MSEPGYGVVANVIAADSCLRMGARVVVEWVPGDPDKAHVRGLSRGGRRVSKWVATKRLGNFRVAWIAKPEWATYSTREEATEKVLSRLISTPDTTATTARSPVPCSVPCRLLVMGAARHRPR